MIHNNKTTNKEVTILSYIVPSEGITTTKQFSFALDIHPVYKVLTSGEAPYLFYTQETKKKSVECKERQMNESSMIYIWTYVPSSNINIYRTVHIHTREYQRRGVNLDQHSLECRYKNISWWGRILYFQYKFVWPRDTTKHMDQRFPPVPWPGGPIIVMMTI